MTNPGAGWRTTSHAYKQPGRYNLSMTMTSDMSGSNLRCNRVFPDTNSRLVNKREMMVIIIDRAEAEIIVSDSVVARNQNIIYTASCDPLYTRYIWDFNKTDTFTKFYPDSTISNTFDKAGVYKIKMIPDYTPPEFTPTCPDTCDQTIVVTDSLLSVQSETESQAWLQVYPNPSSTELKIKLQKGYYITGVTVHDMLGKEHDVEIANGTESAYTMSIKHLAPGHYSMLIRTTLGIFEESIIIQER